MDNVAAVFELDFKTVILGVVTVLLAIVFIYELAKKVLNIFGVEFKAQREKREEHEMLVKNSNDIAKLAKHHEDDAKKLDKKITDFMNEMRTVITDTQNNVNQYSANRINDRQVSIDREKRLNDRIDNMLESDKCRDGVIEDIGSSLKKLTDMFVEKEIADIRFSILEFTSSLSNGKEYNREAYDNVFRMYNKYERILDENNMENGLIEESMKYICEKYNEKLKGDF